jgi:hypothetical protein
MFIEPFQSTISNDGNQLTHSIINRYTKEEVYTNYIKILERVGEETSLTNGQPSSTTDQLRDTLTSTLSQVEDPLTSLQENNLPLPLLLAGLGVAVIGGGTAAYIKHRSSKKSQQEEQLANVEVVTRGGID